MTSTARSRQTAIRRRRRMGGFSDPSDVTGLVAWYDFSNIATLWQDAARTSAVTADGQTILGVTDLAGNYPLSVAANGPTYETAIQNSLSVARFNGTDDTLGNAAFTSATTLTIFCALAKRTAPGATAQSAFALHADSAHIYAHSTSSATLYLYYKNQAGTVIDLTGATAQAWALLTLNHASTSSVSTYYNGSLTQAAFDPNDSYSVATKIQLGSGPVPSIFGDYDIGEFIIYNASLSATNQGLVEAYLKTKWGIA